MQLESLNKRLVLQLGFAGLIPFFLMTLGVWTAEETWIGDFVKGQLAYAMVILSFLGGVHWGVALLSNTLPEDISRRALAWGVTPALIAWCATLFSGFGFAVMMAGFIAALQVDKQLYPAYGMPDWMIPMRKRLTTVVVLLLLLTVIGANVRG